MAESGSSTTARRCAVSCTGAGHHGNHPEADKVCYPRLRGSIKRLLVGCLQSEARTHGDVYHPVDEEYLRFVGQYTSFERAEATRFPSKEDTVKECLHA